MSDFDRAAPEPSTPEPSAPEATSLDPEDWPELRRQAHRMLDDLLDHVESVRERPVWQPTPADVRQRLRAPLPRAGSDLADVHQEFRELVLPYSTGNLHPGFMGWVHGGGTVVGALAELLAAGLNPNLGGRDHAPIEVERQLLGWLRELFGYPEQAGGLFVTGTSIATFIAVLVARTAALGPAVRREGLGEAGSRLVAYVSTAGHGSIVRALEMAGLGSAALRRLPVGPDQRLELAALRHALAADRALGLAPFLVVGNAGTVDTGAIDDLAGIAEIAAAEGLWFHVDGAFGALAKLSPALAPRLAGLERSDSLAFDFHKWGQVPYDAGYILVRDGEQQRAAFAAPAAYLRRETRGLAAGSRWPCDYGPDLSRGFRALKTWFTFKVYGADRLGAMIERSCAVARYLQQRVEATPELELLSPAYLNIVCFRHRGPEPDALNARLVADLHESGLAAPSTTTLNGQLAIRCAIVNHRTGFDDIDRLLAAVLKLGGPGGP